jgi:hypothetical protein
MSTREVTLLNPATPLGFAELLIRDRIRRARARVITGPADRGASVMEWVIISAIVISLALAVGGALKTKLTATVTGLTINGTLP